MYSSSLERQFKSTWKLKVKSIYAFELNFGFCYKYLWILKFFRKYLPCQAKDSEKFVVEIEQLQKIITPGSLFLHHIWNCHTL